MTETRYVDNPDVVLIGSGIMSANLAALLKRLQPSLRIQLYEVTDHLTQEASNGWHNAGTGHAGICELSYTPELRADGTVDVTKAIKIFQQFEHSLQFWARAVDDGMIDNPQEFINPVPHISLVYGEEQVRFLQARFNGLSAHHFFHEMEYTTDRETIRQWAPLLIDGRRDEPLAATKMDAGTDVNFGVVARKLLKWFNNQPDCGIAVGHRVVDLDRVQDGWKIVVKHMRGDRLVASRARFVFIGAGGGTLPLLQKAGIPEIQGYGGFPIGGQWLVCDNPDVVSRHQAKVYGHAQEESPTLAVPHLDTRVIDGKKWLLFGPFAAWTTKFLYHSGSWTDLPRSLKLHNLGSLAKAGFSNLPLVKYTFQQGTQSMASRLQLLRTYYPEARDEDWRLIDAGIRVQTIKQEGGQTGIIHHDTEVMATADKTMCALLGASPGASVSVSIMLDVIEKCLPQLLEEEPGKSAIKHLVPTYGRDFLSEEAADDFRQLSCAAKATLQLTS